MGIAVSINSKPFKTKLGNNTLRAVHKAFVARRDKEFDDLPFANMQAYHACIFASDVIERAARMCDGLDIVYGEKDIDHASQLAWEIAWKSVNVVPSASDVNQLVIFIRSCTSV